MTTNVKVTVVWPSIQSLNDGQTKHTPPFATSCCLCLWRHVWGLHNRTCKFCGQYYRANHPFHVPFKCRQKWTKCIQNQKWYWRMWDGQHNWALEVYLWCQKWVLLRVTLINNWKWYCFGCVICPWNSKLWVKIFFTVPKCKATEYFFTAI